MMRRGLKESDINTLDDDVLDRAEYYESTIAARVALQRATRLTADVVIDLERNGALHHYVIARRTDAIAAIMEIVAADPTDASAIYALQRRIHPYFDACDFIRKTIEEGQEADNTIEEMYGNADQAAD